jgi:hypothetical protein
MYEISFMADIEDDELFDQTDEEYVAEDLGLDLFYDTYREALEVFETLKSDDRVFKVLLRRFELAKLSKAKLALALLNRKGYIKSGSVKVVKEWRDSF